MKFLKKTEFAYQYAQDAVSIYDFIDREKQLAMFRSN